MIDRKAAPSGRVATVILVFVLLAAAAVAAYAFFVEPYWIQVTRHQLGAARLTKPLRIAHLSDLHTRGFGTRERRLATLIESERPDLIVVTGDTAGPGELENARSLFQLLRAPLGVWVVRGDAERRLSSADARRFWTSVGARFLENEGHRIREDLWLMGLEDPGTGRPQPQSAIAGSAASAFKIALFHSPDYFSEVAGLVNLALAGHTHGGQVVLPGLDPLFLPQHGRRYVQGWYAQNNSQLYVSRGIGTTSPGARLLCRPELAIIDLRPN